MATCSRDSHSPEGILVSAPWEDSEDKIVRRWSSALISSRLRSGTESSSSSLSSVCACAAAYVCRIASQDATSAKKPAAASLSTNGGTLFPNIKTGPFLFFPLESLLILFLSFSGSIDMPMISTNMLIKAFISASLQGNPSFLFLPAFFGFPAVAAAAAVSFKAAKSKLPKLTLLLLLLFKGREGPKLIFTSRPRDDVAC
mmetsp:Transcript_31441/g.41906  ORF Transcript_31441/g.41906 Transcript_31441/m.41906 type:complete len:200 (+) Transcript_31441:425-1024(+)